MRPPVVVEGRAERAVLQDAAIGGTPACGVESRDGIGVGDGCRADRFIHEVGCSVPRRRIGGQPVRDRHPRKLRAHEGMVPGRRLVGLVERAGRDVEVAGSTRRLIGQGRAAVGAEGARGVLRRLEALRLAGHEADRVRRHAEPGHRRRAGGMPAHRAMTDRLVGGLGVDLVAHRAAEAASSQHHRLLGLRSMGVIAGDLPAWMVPRISKPCRSYNGTFLRLDDSR